MLSESLAPVAFAPRVWELSTHNAGSEEWPLFTVQCT